MPRRLDARGMLDTLVRANDLDEEKSKQKRVKADMQAEPALVTRRIWFLCAFTSYISIAIQRSTD
jgi:hypothetical protein